MPSQELLDDHGITLENFQTMRRTIRQGQGGPWHAQVVLDALEEAEELLKRIHAGQENECHA